MKHTSETMAESGTPPGRSWAAGLCEALERSAVCYEYWHKVQQETKRWPRWRIWARYCCSRKGLQQRVEGGFRVFMETPLDRFKE